MATKQKLNKDGLVPGQAVDFETIMLVRAGKKPKAAEVEVEDGPETWDKSTLIDELEKLGHTDKAMFTADQEQLLELYLTLAK